LTKHLADAERHCRERTDLWLAFDAVCREARASGLVRWSADAALHVMRWRGWTGRLNNDLTSGLARAWMREAGAEGFFEVRSSPGGGHDDARQRDLFA
jgi:hypothetical protein